MGSASKKLNGVAAAELRAKKVRDEIPDWEARRLVAKFKRQGLISVKPHGLTASELRELKERGKDCRLQIGDLKTAPLPGPLPSEGRGNKVVEFPDQAVAARGDARPPKETNGRGAWPGTQGGQR